MRKNRKKTLSAAVVCAATVLGFAGLSATATATAAPAKLKGDFNGDGYADQAVGVPDATVDGKAKAGYVNVLWGGENGLGAHGSTTVSQNTAGVPGHAEAGDGFGTAVDAADLNGDGFGDLVVGAPNEDVDGLLGAGTVAVVWGSAGGFKGGFTAANGGNDDASYGALLATGDFDGDGKKDIALNSHFDESSSVVVRRGPFRAGSPATVERVDGWHFGGPSALAAGDFDGDGRDDLAVSHTGMEIFGTEVLTRASGAAAEWKGLWSTSDFTRSPSGLATGDFDGDGTADLAVGEVQPNPEAETSDCDDFKGGAILTVYGKKDAPLGGGTACTTQSSPQVGGTAAAGDDFGAALAVGNLDRDGIDELVVGAGHKTVGTAKNAGAYWVLASLGTGKSFAGGMRSQNAADIPGRAEADDLFGARVAVGDYDGDGYPDTTESAPGENSGTGGVWYSRTAPDGPNPAEVSLSPSKLGLSGAKKYGAVLGR